MEKLFLIIQLKIMIRFFVWYMLRQHPTERRKKLLRAGWVMTQYSIDDNMEWETRVYCHKNGAKITDRVKSAV